MMAAVPRRRITFYKGMLWDAVSAFANRKQVQDDAVCLFEKEFSHYIGVRFGIAVSSGTAALSLILDQLGLRPGDEVILPAYTFPSVPICIKEKGLSPCFVDIDPVTDNMDVEDLKNVITDKTKVIIATHLFGRPCRIDAIMAIARKRSIFVIEDCAHAIGASVNGKKVGSFGDAAYCSFSLTKPFNVFNGGMILTDNDDLYSKIMGQVGRLSDMPRQHIVKNILTAYFLYVITLPWIFSVTLYPVLLLLSLFEQDLIGAYNRVFKKIIFYGTAQFKFSYVQAVCGRNMLAFFDEIVRIRRERVRLFQGLISEAGIAPDGRPAHRDTEDFPYFFVMKHPQRAAIAKRLLWQGVDTGKFIMKNCGAMFDPVRDYPNTQRAYDESIQIPIEFCTQKQMQKIVSILKCYFQPSTCDETKGI